MNNLQKQYKEKIVPALMEKFGYKNYLQVPTINKVVLNVGIGSGLKDKGYLELVKKNLQNISGQKSVETLSRKSISNFKVREGMVVGVKVTLRGVRMWDFLERLIKVLCLVSEIFEEFRPKHLTEEAVILWDSRTTPLFRKSKAKNWKKRMDWK